jgi:hypothetical protein
MLVLAAVGLVIAAHWPGGADQDVAGVPPEETAATTAISAPPTAAVTTGTELASTTTAEASTTTTRAAAAARTTTTTRAAAAPTTTTRSTAPPTTVGATPALGFDVDLAMAHIRALAADMGPRKSGTATEDAAVGYAAEYLESLGYSVEVTQVPLPDGSVSHNVLAVKPGASTSTVLVGGHIDTKAGAPGANDNASGAAVVLELARYLSAVETTPTIEFVLFGAEEMVDSNADHHHYGSRRFVADMTSEERSVLVGMISVDMVAYGSSFTVRSMKRGPQQLTGRLLDYSSAHGFGATYLKDTGTYGWSDHEPFELAGYPAAWIEWRDDPKYHTSGDSWDHVKSNSALVRRTGEMLLGFLLSLTEADLHSLAAARTL